MRRSQDLPARLATTLLATLLAFAALAAGRPRVGRAESDGASRALRAALQQIVGSERPSVITAEQETQLRETLGLGRRELLHALAPIAAQQAMPTLSNRYVGAVARGESGKIYLGANVEFRGFHINNTIHAEQFATALAIQHGDQRLTDIALTAAPCGHCRQFLNDLPSSSELRVHIERGASGPRRTTTLGALLPEPFGPFEVGSAPLEGQRQLRIPQRPTARFVALADRALDQARQSRARRGKSPAGVAFETFDGQIFSGGSLEVTGHNPSLTPWQTATIALLSSGRSLSDVRRAALVEQYRPKASHRTAFHAVLSKFAPRAERKVYRATSRPRSARERGRR